MKKKVLLFFICTLLLVGSPDAAEKASGAMTEEEALITAFESSRAEVMESTISCWTKLNSRFINISAVRAEISRIVDIIGLDKVTTVKNAESSEQLNKMVVYGSKDNKSYSIAVESINTDDGGETYLVIDVSMDKSYKTLQSERENIARIVPDNAASVNYSSCIIGTFKGKFSEREAERKTRKVLQAINAKEVEGMESDEMLSISAFSNQVQNFVLSREQRINVQVAVRYSPYDNKTYIWIGTPLIPMEY